MPAYIAEGYASVDQRQGGLLARRPDPCSDQRLVVEDVKGGVSGVKATISSGDVRVLGNRIVAVDLRGAESPATLSLEARAGGQTVKQPRQYRACAGDHR